MHREVFYFPDSKGGLPQNEITIAELLKEKDYSTGIIGKWHLGHLKEHLPTTQGFDYYFGIPYSNDMDFVQGGVDYRQMAYKDPNFLANTSFYNVPLMENDSIIERPTDQNTITRRYTEKAIKFIEANQEQPFFLYLAHNLPHIPLFAHPDFIGSSKRGIYGDVLQEIDQGIGQIIQTLKTLNLDENTLVLFTSDNGPWLWFKTHGGSAGPLRAGKGTNFEGGQRVPAIFWGPGIVEPMVVNEMGSTLDLINTFASLAGIETPNDRPMDGFDLSLLLKGDSNESPRNEFYYWSFGELHAARSGPWKMHLKQRQVLEYWYEVELEQPELYNIETDISEQYELSEQFPEKIQELLTLSKQHRATMQDVLPDNLAASDR